MNIVLLEAGGRLAFVLIIPVWSGTRDISVGPASWCG
jgi:hypothetical protein